MAEDGQGGQADAIDLIPALRAAQAPDAAAQAARLAVAREVAAELRAAEPVMAALAVGSTAFGRCSADSDLDIVVVLPEAPAAHAFATIRRGGLRVELERLGRAAVLAEAAADGWVWELRNAARLGCAVALHDPDDIAGRLRRRAAARRPDPARAEETLRGVYHGLIAVAEAAATADAARRAAFRGCVDNLVLLTLLQTPRRYRKPKWALADLLAAGRDDLARLALAAYGILQDGPDAAAAAIATALAVVERAHAATGAPDHAALLALGYAPDHAEASYVSRCLADAGDLARDGAWIEAQYTAKFAARLAAARLADPAWPAGTDLAAPYRRLFGDDERPGPDQAELAAALACADACAAALDVPVPA